MLHTPAHAFAAVVPTASSVPPLLLAAQPFDYQTAATFNIGGTATVYDTVNTNGLQSLLGAATGLQTTYYRFEPPDQHPPTSAPGLTLDSSRTFTYKVVIAKLGACATGLTVSTPSG